MRRLGPFLVAVLPLGCTPSAAYSEDSGRRTLSLLHLADLHSHLFPENVVATSRDVRLGLARAAGETSSVGGAARIATVLDGERARTDVAVTLDAGDVLEGTATYTYFGGVPEMRVLGALAVDAGALGNHDFSPGIERLRELRAAIPEVPLLAANLVDATGGLARASTLVVRGGIKIHVIGLGRSPDAAPDVADCAAAVQPLVDRGGADVTVVLSHLGSDLDAALVPRTTGIDVVLGGHTHDVIAPPRAVEDCGPTLAARRACRSRLVPVVHSGAYGQFVGRVTLSVEPGVSPARVTGVGLLPVTDAVPQRPDVVALLEPYRAALVDAGVDRAVARAPAGVSRVASGGGDSALGNLVTHALRVRAGADLAVMNSTGIRDDLLAGDITLDDVIRVLPFEDELVTAELSGADLGKVFGAIARVSCERNRVSQAQIDGFTLRLDCDSGSPPELRIAGRVVDAAGRYLVATASFLTESGGWLEGAPLTRSGQSVRNALLAYLGGLPPCSPDAGSATVPCVGPAAGAVQDGRITWR